MRTESANTKYYSNKQESMVAKELGGYQIGMSGAAPGCPGDVKTWDWLVECKTHTDPGQNILFNYAVWCKVKIEAMSMHRKPVLIVDDGSQRASKTWCLCKASNLNLSSVITVDFPVRIRKNVTCKEDIMQSSLKSSARRYLGEFYSTAVYSTNWVGEEVIICPLSTFKELFEK